MSRLPSSFGIIVMLGFALVIRLVAVGYGLPLHLYADEEVNIYSALKMMQLHTLLPVLHPGVFTILYEPPVLSYLYALFFVPATLVLLVTHGMPSFSVLADLILLDPSPFFVVGRIVTVALSLGSIYLLYRIANILFANRCAALFSALFLATSFFHTTLAVTARHWEISTFLSLLSLFFVLLRTTHAEKWWLIPAAGASLGFSFGAGYLVFYAPCIGLLILYYRWHEVRSFAMSHYLRPVLLFITPFMAIAALSVVVAPDPFYKQVLTHVYADRHTLVAFIAFYSQSLWRYETLLAVGTLVGLGALVRDRAWNILFFIGLFLATMLPIIFVFLWDLDRYVYPLLPILALTAGYGAYAVTRNAPRALPVLVALIVIYACAVFVRFDVLMLRNDTRVHAHVWVEANIPAGSTLLVDSERMRFRSTPAAVTATETVDAGAVRAPDRVTLDNGSPTFNTFNMYLLLEEDTQAAIDAARALDAETYVITDTWSDTEAIRRLVDGKTPIQTFSSDSIRPIPHGLFIGGEEHYENRAHILKLLWDTRFFGPDVSIYKLN